jgi:single stranded DNA-binding protein (ssb)
MNKVMLIGRLGKDPELRYAANGSPIANIRIATDDSYTDRDGNKVDRTEWHTVVVFQRQAEACQKYLKKGSLVFVEGSILTRKWQDQQGQDRYSTEVKAVRVQFLDRHREEEHTNLRGNASKSPWPTSGRIEERQPNATLEYGNESFPSEVSAMDAMPWDMPPSRSQYPNNGSEGESDVPF